MSEHKSQHFVPRFYLKHFSFNGGGHTNLIRCGNLKAISSIAVTGQCQESFFYGEDLKMEKALSLIEGAGRNVFAQILRDGRLPPAASSDDAVLKSFVALQWIRTRLFADSFDRGLSKMLKAVYRERFRAAGFSDEQMATVEIQRTEGPRESVAQGVDFLPFFWDLDAKLVHANGLGEFVTSDNPVVMLNPHYLGRFEGGVIGAALEGTVVLFPLAPDYLVILSDPRCYRVGADGNPFVPLGSAPDLAALNNHQFLHAGKCVYHRAANRAGMHVREFEAVRKLRLTERQIVREIARPDGTALLHTFEQAVPYAPQFAFMKVRPERRHEIGQVATVPPRDRALSAHFESYTEAVRAGKCPRGFVAYIAKMAESMLTPEERVKLEAEWAAGSKR